MGEASPEPGSSTAGGSPAPPRKGKSCKGCLYYSSALKSRGYNPICVGIPRSISQVPNYVVDEPKEEAMAQGHDLRQFRYGCAGYSMYVDNRDGQGAESEGKTLLPYCRGLELLADSRLVEKKPSTAELAPAHVSNDAAATARSHQQGQQRPAHLARQEFLGRFKRSAGLVASGVAKNLNKTANYIKENIQDIVYPDRRPPK
ncbi:uncharacterized protein LOC120661343 isoform X1 [Panicum virgatum]|uniref:DUF8204 domain-containing protein n=1 Tax=Panicum virgatum TaxID=38727 RepID=A0A8T0VPK5_PANVG|nr:uncharacterized protein LOC120661343 isoform X1 [Panicum virgatum]KAG2636367.1 hypothetical protein PVAP13_2NG447000 [Panicum virgatum]